MKLAYLLLVIPLLCGVLFAETVQQCSQKCCLEAGGTYYTGDRGCEHADYVKYDSCMMKCETPESAPRIPDWCFGATILLAGALLMAEYKISVMRR
jgi:hypothetical protein